VLHHTHTHQDTRTHTHTHTHYRLQCCTRLQELELTQIPTAEETLVSASLQMLAISALEAGHVPKLAAVRLPSLQASVCVRVCVAQNCCTHDGRMKV
jgi:hypothetical protein